MIRDLTTEDVQEAISKNKLIAIQTKAGNEKRLEVDFDQNFIVTKNKAHVYATKIMADAVKDYNMLKL